MKNARLLVAVAAALTLGGCSDSDPAPLPMAPPVATAAATSPVAGRPSAEAVEKAFLEGIGLDKLSDGLTGPDPTDPIFHISEWRDEGGVLVVVQEDITEEQARRVGVTIFNVVGHQFPALDAIVVRGTNGLDVTVLRGDAPSADG